MLPRRKGRCHRTSREGTGLPWDGLLIAAVVIFAAALLRGYAGFGFSTLLVAGLIFRFPASQIVPLSIALEILASLGQARGIHRDIDRRALVFLLLAGFAGNPIGVVLLSHMPDAPLRIAVHVVILVAVSALLFHPTRPVARQAPVLLIAGFVAGVVNGATALSGLVLGLFLTATDIDPRAMRATMIAYFFVTDIWAGGLLAIAGHYDRDTLAAILAAVPVLALGVWLGGRAFATTASALFRRRVLWLLLALSIAGLAMAIL